MSQFANGSENRLFRLSYIHKLPDDEESEEYFHIGIYSSRETAEIALANLVEQPGFRDDPDGFIIDEQVLDETSWQEGFITESFPNAPPLKAGSAEFDATA
jgi:hypothetical protein